MKGSGGMIKSMEKEFNIMRKVKNKKEFGKMGYLLVLMINPKIKIKY